jgi:N-acetyl-D-muramate 6-phosphate phosphatase
VLHAVIFDLDGTLLDTESDFTHVLNQQLRDHGKPATTSAQVRNFVSAGASSIVRQGFDLADNDPALPALLEDFLNRYSAQIQQTTAALFDDIDLLIASLVEQGISWGIMTNKHRRFSEPLLSKFENFATSGALVCPDDVGAGKPDPKGILHACQLLGAQPQHAIYVGDHPRDIDAARNAGMASVAVAWGYLPTEPALSAWGADFIANTPKELLSWCLQQHL